MQGARTCKHVLCSHHHCLKHYSKKLVLPGICWRKSKWCVSRETGNIYKNRANSLSATGQGLVLLHPSVCETLYWNISMMLHYRGGWEGKGFNPNSLGILQVFLYLNLACLSLRRWNLEVIPYSHFTQWKVLYLPFSSLFPRCFPGCLPHVEEM